jgi:hypothetical protein
MLWVGSIRTDRMEEHRIDPRMVSDLVASHEPVGDKSIVRVIQGDIIGYSGRTTIRILTLSKELVDRINRVGLDGIIGGIDDKLGDITLAKSEIRNLCWQENWSETAIVIEARDFFLEYERGGGTERESGWFNYRTQSTWRACASAIALWELACRSLARVSRGIGAAHWATNTAILCQRESR